ncbi:MAG: NfeD family protein [Oscillospiraceae bacterium]|nr:NfeD family protein [Oscillospiraceae bacterium]
MTIFWASAAVLFLIIEAATVGIASIWFALGSLCALVAALLGAPLWLQIAWFIVISIATLIFTRPFVKRFVHAKRQPTNADRVIGSVCKVTETVDNIAGTGCVSVDGKLWSARSVDGIVIEEGSLVEIKEIQGVKLMVIPAQQDQQ